MPAHTMPDIDRFMQKTRRDPVTGCLEWIAARLEASGYGVFGIRDRTVRAHRWILEQHLGRALRPGMLALHRCDNPPCVAVEHLYEGDHRRNALDALERGQALHGERATRARLTEAQVLAIRNELATGRSTQKQLAERYDIDPSAISRINSGLRWAYSAGGESDARA